MGGKEEGRDGERERERERARERENDCREANKKGKTGAAAHKCASLPQANTTPPKAVPSFDKILTFDCLQQITQLHQAAYLGKC